MHGPARYVQTLARGLADRAVEVHVVTPHPDLYRDFTEASYHVHLRQVSFVRGVSRLQAGIAESFQLWQAIRVLQQQHHFDLVEFTNVEGIGFVTSFFDGVPTIVRAHTTAFDACRLGIGNRRLEEGYARLERWTAQRASAVVTHSRSHQRQIALDYRLSRDAIHVVPHGISPLVPDRPVARRSQQILSVGAASIRKGVVTFLAAANALVKEFPEMRFIWAGQDTRTAPGERTWTEHTAAEMPQLLGKIEFRVIASDADLASLYAESTCYLCTALYESFGITLVEAMFAGLPVVAPNTAAMAEIVTDRETGRLYRPDSLEDLMAHVRAIVSSPDEREYVTGKALQRARAEYGADVMVSRMMDLYGNVC
jgi:glycosyltransferase involved in cell wall biosynthesis